MEEILSLLRVIQKEQGEEYLQREPCQVYRRLVEAGAEKPKARLVLVSLLAGVGEMAREGKAGVLSAYLQRECFLRKRAADGLAEMYLDLFAPPRPADWEEQCEKSLREFCGRTWRFTWDGKGSWEIPEGISDLTCSLEADLGGKDPEKVRKFLRPLWEKSSTVSGEGCSRFFRRKLRAQLKEALLEFIEEEGQHPPYLEEYYEEFEEVVQTFCAEYGLRYSGLEYEGYTGDVEWNPSW